MFYLGERGLYCRKCIKFGTVAPKEDDIKEVDAQYHLKFELTQRQKEVSDSLCFHFNNGRNVLLEAVCGRGKTELVFAVISMALKQGKHVGMTIARRQVVLEIASRLQEAFPAVKVTPVCMGFTADTDGDLIICTTHQLYRFTDYFDLLIIDAYGIIGLNSKDSINKGFSGISPILFSPQKRLTVELRRCHAQIKDFSAKRPAAGMHSSIAGSIIPFCVLQRQSNELSSDVDLHRSSLWNQKDVSLACTA